ncbi:MULTISPECIES: hypothetical protein [unclassified Luteococcus]|uniref:hypothetical protein n=1 Tax=unclassified Luteococcus TaxID=2639923 RepID=UPI00313D5D5C
MTDPESELEQPLARPRRGMIEPDDPGVEDHAGGQSDPDHAFRRPGSPASPTSPARPATSSSASRLRSPASGGATAAPVTEEIDDGPRRPPWVWLAAPVVLALGLGGWWLAGRSDEEPVAQPTPTPSQSIEPLQPKAPEQPSVIEAPGKGTVDSVKKQLIADGFTCESEAKKRMDSWVCTHYTSNPAMTAYLGGASGHRLGRVSLNVQDGKGGKNPTALAIQGWLAEQFIGDKARTQTVLKAVRAGNEDSYATATNEEVNARGSADGSIVLFVDGWVPDQVQPEKLLQAKPLGQALTQRGYSCTGEAEVKCTRTADGYRYSLDYRPEGMEVSYLKLRTEATAKQPVLKAAADEVQAVTSLFQQGRQIQTWLAAHQRSAAGATGYQDGLALDWYPGSSQPGGAAAVFYLRQACWTDTVETC